MKKQIIYKLTFALCLAVLLDSGLTQAAVTASPKSDETKTTESTSRMQWWREARYGMFIHWGIYAVPAHAEWYMTTGHVPKSRYEQYAKEFDPTNFDAAEWVRVAKDAGMKYLVITSKHHDGFCMFDTKATDYNVVNDTPWHHDPLKDLSEQCRKQGVRFCVYYSIMDWHSPDQAPANADPEHPTYNPTKMRPGHKADYVKYMKTQLHELITQYHPGVIWFDGDWPNWWTVADGKELYTWLRQQDPELIINNRVAKRGPAVGDYGTPEQHIPSTGLKEDWETCMTINNSWGFNQDDHQFKSAATLIHNLIDIASKGGNYLLNVGPTAQGVIPPPEVDRLEAMGCWMKANGAAIYGTTASPFKRLPWGRCTKTVRGEETTLYLHVFDWPTDGRLLVPGLTNTMESAQLLVDGQKLKWQATDDGVQLAVPASAPDAISSTIVLTVKGVPVVADTPILQNADGSVHLPANEAVLHGSLQCEGGTDAANIGFWTDPNDFVSWTFKVNQPGKFNLTADLAAFGAAQFEVSLGGQTLLGTAPETKDYKKYTVVNLDGTLTIPHSGLVTLKVKPVAQGWQPVNLRRLSLTPVKS